jgi:hypothetical protein
MKCQRELWLSKEIEYNQILQRQKSSSHLPRRHIFLNNSVSMRQLNYILSFVRWIDIWVAVLHLVTYLNISLVYKANRNNIQFCFI